MDFEKILMDPDVGVTSPRRKINCGGFAGAVGAE